MLAGRLLRVTGRIERDGPMVHLVAERIEHVSYLLGTLGRGADMPANDGRADKTMRPVGGSVREVPRWQREKGRGRFESRDFR